MNLINRIKTIFKKDVEALLSDFTDIATKLKNRSEELITEAVQLQAVAQNKLSQAAKANKASANILGLIS